MGYLKYLGIQGVRFKVHILSARIVGDYALRKPAMPLILNPFRV